MRVAAEALVPQAGSVRGSVQPPGAASALLPGGTGGCSCEARESSTAGSAKPDGNAPLAR